jgi:hypothetical protein
MDVHSFDATEFASHCEKSPLITRPLGESGDNVVSYPIRATSAAVPADRGLPRLQ